MSTLYFKDNEEICYPLASHIEEARQEGLNEIKLYHAKKVDDLDYFYCKAYKEVGEVGQCGRSCAKYTPQNKLSGKCKHRGFLYENTGIVRIVTIKPEVDQELRQRVIDSYFNTPQQHIDETAKMFGLTYNQAKNIIYHSGRKKKRFNPRQILPEKRKEIYDSWYSNPDQTQVEIARKFGISQVTVHHIINEFSNFRHV
jgi:hypothetical protein